MTLVLAWRLPPRALTLRWRGPEGMSQPTERGLVTPLAAIIGPRGIQGEMGTVPDPGDLTIYFQNGLT